MTTGDTDTDTTMTDGTDDLAGDTDPRRDTKHHLGGVAAALAGVLDPVGTYQVAAACDDAYLGLGTRDRFANSDEPLFDAGERLEGRLADIPGALAPEQTSVGGAAELACSAVKYAGELPAPFDALDAELYREHGAAYAAECADRTAETLC
jgi:hypothetical protein